MNVDAVPAKVEIGAFLRQVKVMKTPSIGFALCASLFAALIVAVNAMPLPALDRQKQPVMEVQAQGGSSVRRPETEDNYRRDLRRRSVDCHRDVRTHRINGEFVRHRHVGENCDVRVVRRSTQPAVPGN